MGDIAVTVTHNDVRYAAEEIGILCRRFPEVWNKIQHLKFPGRGQRETPAGDIHTVVEFILLLPGRHAAQVRRQAAELFVRYFSGDLNIVAEVCRIRGFQEELAAHQPSDARRICSHAVLVADGQAHAPVETAALLNNPPPALRAYLGQDGLP